MGTSSERIRSEIETTRKELRRDVDRLAAHAAPRRAVGRRAAHVRHAVTEVRERLWGRGNQQPR